MAHLGFDPHRDDVMADPFRWYRWLRRQARAYRVESGGFYAVSRHEDVVTVTKEHATFSSTGGVGFAWNAHPMMSMYDPPDHTRLRRIVAAAFTPKTIQALRPAMEEESRRLLEANAERPFDFVTGIAEPLVAAVVGDLIGVPREVAVHFRRWSLSVTGILAGNLDAAHGEEDRRELVQAMREAKGHGLGLIRVLSDASAAERLSDRELTAFCVLLLVAGFETTVNGMANAAFTLMNHCDAFAALARAPHSAPAVIEEVLRFDPPVHAFFRNTLRPWTFPDGSSIPEGKKVMVLFGSACHDEERYVHADRFDPERPPLPSVAFGNGVHYCIGAPLARALYDVFLRTFLASRRRLVATGAPRRTHNSMLRGFEALPVVLTEPAGAP
jgi:cytochrome P450